jgi:hypothetical protein
VQEISTLLLNELFKPQFYCYTFFVKVFLNVNKFEDLAFNY